MNDLSHSPATALPKVWYWRIMPVGVVSAMVGGAVFMVLTLTVTAAEGDFPGMAQAMRGISAGVIMAAGIAVLLALPMTVAWNLSVIGLRRWLAFHRAVVVASVGWMTAGIFGAFMVFLELRATDLGLLVASATVAASVAGLLTRSVFRGIDPVGVSRGKGKAE